MKSIWPTLTNRVFGFESAIEKQVSNFAAGFRDQQAAVERSAMGRAVAAVIVGLVVGADRIVGTDG